MLTTFSYFFIPDVKKFDAESEKRFINVFLTQIPHYTLQ
jgi:hypothetical protein